MASLELDLSCPRRDLVVEARLAVEAGGPLALVGPSGAGKSTILRAAAGLLRPRAGVVRCLGETWLDTGAGIDLPPERRRCGYLFQEYALFEHLTAAANVAFGLRGGRRRARLRRAEGLLARFGAEALAEARPAELSGGERQRVALARALAIQPRALLLDEPLAALDATTRSAATRTLAELIGEAGVPTVIVTHDFVEASTLAGELAVIESGRIVQRGSPEALSARPVSAFVAEITGASVLEGAATEGAGGLTEVILDGGGRIASTDPGSGPVAVSVHPWEIALEPAGTDLHGSQRNRLEGSIVSVATIGSRVRVGIDVGRPLVAEVTRPARDALGLQPGTRVLAVWKASATRLQPR